MATCHSCGSTQVTVVPTPPLRGVTSDCRPWDRIGALGLCATCGLVQQITDDAWRDDVRRIYSSYDIYHQSGGAEQLIFDTDRAPAPRSARVLGTFAERNALPERGSLLDVGCGNGALLRTFAGLFPLWDLWGSELTDQKRPIVESIPGVRGLYVGDVSEIDRTFDLVTLMHVLEHIASPRSFLRHIKDRLRPDGRLLVQVPDLNENPFDLLVADHASHFTDRSAGRLLRDAGFEIAAIPANVVSKELTIEARPASAVAGSAEQRSAGDGVTGAVEWLARVKGDAVEAAHGRVFGVFGTSIAGTWLANELGDAVAFFVDEDASRIGREHMGRKILGPDSVPAGAMVYVVLVPHAATDVARRLSGGRFDLMTPRTWSGRRVDRTH